MTGTDVGAHVGVFLRGFAIVTLTSLNVLSIAKGHYPTALLGGFGISWIWFGNARSAAHSNAKYARFCYAAGAAVGTITGMWAVTWIYR